MSEDQVPEVVEPQAVAPIDAAAAQQAVAMQINKGLLPALESMASEIESRAASGRLDEEVEGMKLTSILGQMARILQAVNQSMPKLNLNVNVNAKDATWLRAKSTTTLTEAQREKLRSSLRKK